MLNAVRIVLVRPRFPENIGMVARAMANMGAKNLVLVEPERWEIDRALPLATEQGKEILHTCKLADSLEEAIASCVAAFGTTARTGGWRRELLTPEEAARHIRKAARESANLPGTVENTADTSRIALVFGSEDRGLENAETDLCTRLITIPTSKDNSSLNLAQAVLIILYECMKADMALPFEPEGEKQWLLGTARAESRRATMEEESLLMSSLRAVLVDIGHLPSDNPDWFMRPMRRFLRKHRLRRHEYDMIMGICRRVKSLKENKNK